MGDLLLLQAIRRAILDSFWARATSTVEDNARELKRHILCLDKIQIREPYAQKYPRGPLALDDTYGMLTAVSLLIRTLDPGRNSKTVQYGTARSIQLVLSNYCNTTEEGSGLVAVADRQKQHFTSGGTTHLFYEWFGIG